MGAAAARTEATKPAAAPALPARPPSRHVSTDAAPVGGAPFLRLAHLATPPLTDAPPQVRSTLSRDPGSPLSVPVRGALEAGLGVDLGAVRVHQSPAATALVGEAGARAFAYGPHVFLGASEQPTDIRLMAHEAAHVVQQQGAPQVQRYLGDPAGDACEHEATRVATAVATGQPATVHARTSPRPQFLFESVRGAISAVGSAVRGAASGAVSAATDIAGVALGFIRDNARRIPYYDLLALILGRDPLTQAPVPRTATNIIRAVVGLWPGGSYVYDALQRYGLIDRVGGWLETQFRTLAAVVGGIRGALTTFIASLGIADVAHPGAVWERARRIFTEPVTAATSFITGLVRDVLGFIRTAVLRPLARLAEGTRGYDLVRLVLGFDPITGEPYPRTPENVIGGFMRLIGQEEKWRYLVESRAVSRAWAWFQQQMGTLRGFVSRVPGLFVQALEALQVSDLLDLPGAFVRIAVIFGGFYLEYVTWASGAALQVMLFIFEVLAPGAMPVLRRAGTVIRTIVSDPIRFVGNFVRAGLGGFRLFVTNIGTHLINGLIGWLTGALSGAGLQLPERWDLRGILSLVLQILGITWQNIRQKLLRHIPEPVLRGLETTFDILVTLVRDGPTAAWQQIVGQLQDLREVVFGAVRNWVIQTIVVQAVSRIASWFTPAGVVVEAVLAIYNTIMFLIERARQIIQVVESYFNAIAEIAMGNIAPAAARVEQTLGRIIPVVISFLARLIGLGGISNTIRNIITRLRAPIDRALDRLVDWIAAQVQRLGRGAGSRAGAAPAPGSNQVDRPTTIGGRHTVRGRIVGTQAEFTMASDKFDDVRLQVTRLTDAYLNERTGIFSAPAQAAAANALQRRIGAMDPPTGVLGLLRAGIIAVREARTDRERYFELENAVGEIANEIEELGEYMVATFGASFGGGGAVAVGATVLIVRSNRAGTVRQRGILMPERHEGVATHRAGQLGIEIDDNGSRAPYAYADYGVTWNTAPAKPAYQISTGGGPGPHARWVILPFAPQAGGAGPAISLAHLPSAMALLYVRRGHLIAEMFGGPGGWDNIVPMTFNANQRRMASVEATTRNALPAAATPTSIVVRYTVTPNYATPSDAAARLPPPSLTVLVEQEWPLPASGVRPQIRYVPSLDNTT